MDLFQRLVFAFQRDVETGGEGVVEEDSGLSTCLSSSRGDSLSSEPSRSSRSAVDVGYDRVATLQTLDEIVRFA